MIILYNLNLSFQLVLDNVATNNGVKIVSVGHGPIVSHWAVTTIFGPIP